MTLKTPRQAERLIVCLGPEQRRGAKVCGSESPWCSGAVETVEVKSQNLEKRGISSTLNRTVYRERERGKEKSLEQGEGAKEHVMRG